MIFFSDNRWKIKDEFGDVIGNDVITDRGKLNQFLI